MRRLVVTSFLFLSACTMAVGNGKVTSQAREVGAFRRVSIESGITGTVTTGSRAVTVRTDENLQALVETVVEGEVLKVRVRATTGLTNPHALDVAITSDVIEGVFASGGVDVTAAATPCDGFFLDASGGSRIAVSGVSASTINATASGGSNVTLSGAATNGTIVGSGGARLDLKALPLTSATIDLSGASTLRASVSTTLIGMLSGGSTATITGTPSSDGVSTSGASELIKGAP